MTFKILLARVRAILADPKGEWSVIAAEQTTTKDLYVGYILLLAAIGPFAGFFKMSVFGMNIPLMGTYRQGIVAGLGHMLLSYLLTLVAVYLIALIVNMLAPSFGGHKDQMQALKTVAYAYTAAWIAGGAQLLPWLGMLVLLAGSVYSIYLLHLGLPVTMKCPQEKATGYTAAVIVVAIIFNFALMTVVGGITGGMGTMGGKSPSPMNRPDTGGFDKDSPGGKIEAWTKNMEEAGKGMEEAQQSGDSKAQQAAMGKMMAATMGSSGTIETLAPERIKAFLPETLAGRPRSAVSAERTGAMGFQISTAKASYEDRSGAGLRVEITDMGLAKGVMALAGWMGVEQESVTETGYEKTYKKDKDLVHEKWDKQASTGEYSRVLGERFTVTVSGGAASIEALKDAAEGIDLQGLAALKDEGVTK